MNPKSDVKGALFLFLLGLFFTVKAWFIPKPLIQQDVTTTPAFFPLLVGSVFTGLALIQLLMALFLRRPSEPATEQRISMRRRLPAFSILVILFGYIVAMQIFGWLASSIAMVAVVLWVSAAATQRRTNLWLNLLLAVTFALAVFVIFDLLLNVPLPRGIWSIEAGMGL